MTKTKWLIRFIALAISSYAVSCAIADSVYEKANKQKLISHNVKAASMEPTLSLGSVVLASPSFYQSPQNIKRGDIVLYSHYHNRKPIPFCFRVVGIPGDQIRILNEDVWVNGKKLRHKVLSRDKSKVKFREWNAGVSYQIQYFHTWDADADNPEPEQYKKMWMRIPKDKFFVLGDNRRNAADSRIFGLVPFSSIIGKAWKSK